MTASAAANVKSVLRVMQSVYNGARHMKPLSLLAAAATFTLALSAAQPATVQEAQRFIAAAEARLLTLAVDDNRADWVKSTYITDDTEALAAKLDERLINATVELAKKSTRFDSLKLPPDVARKMKLLKLSLTLATPANPKESEELTRIAAAMEGAYGKGKYCPPGKKECLDLEELSRIMANSRNPNELLEAWKGWHAIARPMRADYVRYVALANKGARELGFADDGAMWRAKYDMPPDAFAKELDRLWEQVRPLYVSLHAYVRTKLREKYGDVVPADGPIPAHLLGNMWAQTWDNVYPLVAPQDADPGFDLTEILKGRKTDYKQMVKYGERFFTSLGFAPLPETFWERSLFVKPRDREVVCHASAWDIDSVDDVRLKMCIEITAEDFLTIHHELGHNFYQRAYDKQPFLFRDSANDGFHEAVGDTIALSVTPAYLVKIGLLKQAPDTSKDIGLLLAQGAGKDRVPAVRPGHRPVALEGILRRNSAGKIQSNLVGAAPQISGHRAAGGAQRRGFRSRRQVSRRRPTCRTCAISWRTFCNSSFIAPCRGSPAATSRSTAAPSTTIKEAGRRLNDMLEMGASRPWPEALAKLTGESQMDATAIRDYFAPLQKWLDEQNKGKPVGW